MNARISIVVPIYNAERYLKNCLDSLVNQTYKNLEIICVNDGSTDNSLSIVSKYAEKDPRIILVNQVNSGVSVARNVALSKVTGDYVMFVDSDDWIDLNTCEETLEYALKYNSDVVLWTYVREFADKSLKKKIFDEDFILFDEKEVKDKLHRRLFGLINEELAHPENGDAIAPVCFKLYKKELFKMSNAKFVDLSKIGSCEDGLFNIEVFKYIKSAVFLNNGYYHYRKDNNLSQTSVYREYLVEQWKALFSIMQSYIDDNCCEEQFQTALNNRIAISVIFLGLNVLESNKTLINMIKDIKAILRLKMYDEVYCTFETKYLSFCWKILILMAKHKRAGLVYVLLMIVKKIRGK